MYQAGDVDDSGGRLHCRDSHHMCVCVRGMGLGDREGPSG